MMTHRPFRTLFACCLVILTILGALPAHVAAQETERVAAVVNDDVVSMRDLEQRLKLVLMSSNLPDTMETRSRIVPQVLRRLIDERLQIDEAKRLKITLAPAEIDAGVGAIEHQNNMPPGAFVPFLKSKGIDPDTVRQQVRAQLSWVRVVRRELMPEVHIGEEEIDARLAALKANLGKPEYLAAEIFLAVDDPSREAEIRNLAERLIEQMHQGAPFSALARQFSQTGAAGGDLGWVSAGELDDQLMNALAHMQPGTVTPPLRTLDGYHILFLRDRRIAGQGMSTGPTLDVLTVALSSLPSATSAERETQLKRLREALAKGNSCDDYERLAKEMPSVDTTLATKVPVAEIPVEVRQLLADLKPGQISEPLDTQEVTRMFAVCGRHDDKDGLPSRDAIRRRVEDERLDIMAARYLRDLRRAAFVEIRA